MRKWDYYWKQAVALALMCALMVGAVFLRWDYANRPDTLPALDRAFVQSLLARIPSGNLKSTDSMQLTQNDFEGLVIWRVHPLADTPSQAYIAELEQDLKYGLGKVDKETFEKTLYCSADKTRALQFYGHQYMPVVKTWGYGWFYPDGGGNLLAMHFGEEAAEGVPNYRNEYTFTLVNETAAHTLYVYTNEKDPQKTLTAVMAQLEGGAQA